MAKRKAGTKKAERTTDGQNGGPNGGIVALTNELFQAAITLRGSVEPADYKRYVLPIIFLRFLSLRYDRRRACADPVRAQSAIDRFTSNAYDLIMEGESYRPRLKPRLVTEPKAGAR